MSVENVSAALSAIRHRLAGAAQQTRAVAESLAARQAELARLWHDSTHPAVEAATGQLAAAVERLRDAVQESAAAEQAVAAYQERITGGMPALPAMPTERAHVSVSAQYDYQGGRDPNARRARRRGRTPVRHPGSAVDAACRTR